MHHHHHETPALTLVKMKRSEEISESNGQLACHVLLMPCTAKLVSLSLLALSAAEALDRQIEHSTHSLVPLLVCAWGDPTVLCTMTHNVNNSWLIG